MIKRLRKLFGRKEAKPNSNKYPRYEKPDAIILAAGMMGKRALFPKALFDYGGKTAIEHQINWLKPFVKKIIIACPQNECRDIFRYLGPWEDVEYSTESQLLGTAGAVKNAMKKSKAENFIICNVDDLTDIDLNALVDFGPDTICVANPRLNFGVIEMEEFDIKQFREKPLLKNIWASCGVYLVGRKTVEEFPERGGLEHDVWPYITIKAFKHFGVWKTFGR